MKFQTRVSRVSRKAIWAGERRVPSTSPSFKAQQKVADSLPRKTRTGVPCPGSSGKISVESKRTDNPPGPYFVNFVFIKLDCFNQHALFVQSASKAKFLRLFEGFEATGKRFGCPARTAKEGSSCPMGDDVLHMVRTAWGGQWKESKHFLIYFSMGGKRGDSLGKRGKTALPRLWKTALQAALQRPIFRS